MKKKRNKQKLDILSILIIIVLAIALVLAIVLGVLMLKGKSKEVPETESFTVEKTLEETSKTTADNNSSMTTDKWQEGTILYNNKRYKYNTDQDVFLLMGIDNDNPIEEAEDYVHGGQSDAIFLLVVNREKESMFVVPIHRNTMTKIFTCDADGTASGYTTAQICVQHGFGDGKKLSCRRTVDAVSNMFYGIPINGYIAMNMGGVPAMNDAIGGVKVKVLQDIQKEDASLTKGEETTLSGKEAYYYLRYRDINEYDSASGRLERQNQYINAYISKLKKALADGSISGGALFNAVSDYVVTDLTVAEFIGKVGFYQYDSNNMYTLPGEVKMGERFEEFYLNEDAFYEMILKLFYVEVKED